MIAAEDTRYTAGGGMVYKGWEFFPFRHYEAQQRYSANQGEGQEGGREKKG